jgi:hypothetical protein
VSVHGAPAAAVAVDGRRVRAARRGMGTGAPTAPIVANAKGVVPGRGVRPETAVCTHPSRSARQCQRATTPAGRRHTVPWREYAFMRCDERASR